MILSLPKAALAAVLSLGLLASAPAAPAQAQGATIALSEHDLVLVKKATDYLQGLTEMQGRFEQTSPRGAVETGDIFLKRPGKVRFQYDPPTGVVVVSDGAHVAQWDPRLRTYDRILLGATPLAIILARKVSLDQDVEVTRVGRYEDGFYLSARSTHGQAETEGSITLVFGENPMTLRGWTLVDGQGQATKIKLLNFDPTPVRPDLFVLNDPRSPEERKEAGGRRKGPAKAVADQGAAVPVR